MSVSTLTVSRNNGVYRSKTLCGTGTQFNSTNKTHMMNSGLGRHNMLGLFLSTHSNVLRQRGVRVRARWPFKGSDQGMDASSEKSESANEDILIFFFQLDLATRVQFALNMEQYEIAQQLRNKLTEVEEEVARQRDAKRGSTSKSEAQDKALLILRLRTDMRKAIENENYTLAAELRDEISRAEADSLAVSVKALAYENVQYAFRLGQKLRHKMFGYQAVVCGMDPVCCESSSWMEAAHVEKLPRGSNQPFYQHLHLPVRNFRLELHAWLWEVVSRVKNGGVVYDLVLVDVRAYPNLLVAYVPEENLLAPDKPDKDRFDNPYVSFLFYGVDTAGDFIPIKQLREKYNRPRYEVPLDSEDEDGKEDT